MFVKKTIQELEAMTPDELQAYKSAEEAHNIAERDKAIDTKLDIVKTQLTSEMQDTITEIAKNITQNQMTFKQRIHEAFKEKEQEIKDTYKSGRFVELTIKSPPGTITTGNGALPDGIPTQAGAEIAPPSPINMRDVAILGYTNNINTTQATLYYTEVVPKSGDFGAVAEGGIKPQTDFIWETRTTQPVKIAAWEQLTQEASMDIPQLESIAYDFLFKKHNIFKARQILFGNGTYPNALGATTLASTFNAGALAGSVSNPNFLDTVGAVATSISTTHNYQDETPYKPNLVLVNPIDYFIYVYSAKTSFGTKLFPDAGVDMYNVGNFTIIADELIPAGKVFVADMSKYNTSNYLAYKVLIGWINDNLIKNQFVILGESRFHAFVKNLDKVAFVYDDIAVIQNAIKQ